MPDAVLPVHPELGRSDNVKLPIVAISVAALTPTHLMPWWAYLVLALGCVANSTCRTFLGFKLCSKALDKANPAQAAAIISAAFARHGERIRGRLFKILS